MVLVPTHEEQVGRGQHRDSHASVCKPLAEFAQPFRRQARVLRPVADGNPTAPAELLGEVADEMNVHVVGRGADVEVDVDVDVEFARELKNAVDLSGMVRIVTGRAPDNRSAALESFHDVGVGLGDVGPALLREDAELEVDRPAIVLGELL